MPPVLFARGEVKSGDRLAVAVVGMRRPSHYGRQVAEQLGRDLARHGVTVVSGLARGVDTSAHKAALAAGRGAAPRPVEIAKDDVAFLQYTGGTTGVSKGASIDFPILDPANIFGLLLGKPATLFTLEFPEFGFEFLYRQVIPIIGPLAGTFAGKIGGTFDFVNSLLLRFLNTGNCFFRFCL